MIFGSEERIFSIFLNRLCLAFGSREHLSLNGPVFQAIRLAFSSQRLVDLDKLKTSAPSLLSIKIVLSARTISSEKVWD